VVSAVEFVSQPVEGEVSASGVAGDDGYAEFFQDVLRNDPR
jgi:hypothetical protein